MKWIAVYFTQLFLYVDYITYYYHDEGIDGIYYTGDKLKDVIFFFTLLVITTKPEKEDISFTHVCSATIIFLIIRWIIECIALVKGMEIAELRGLLRMEFSLLCLLVIYTICCHLIGKLYK